MPPPRPIQRDDVRGNGAPVFVERYSSGWAGSRKPRTAAVTHQFAVLGFYTGGSANVEQGAKWTLRAGDVLLVPPGQPHRMLNTSGAELWGVGVCATCFAAEDAGVLLEPFERVRAGASAVVHIPVERHAFLERLLIELREATSERRRAEPLAIQRSLLTLVLNEVARAAEPAAANPAPLGVVASSLKFIERNCLRRLTLSEVAHAVGLTPAYVTTALTKATGRSAGAWITAGRMAEARRLLLHSSEMVDVVAQRVGYEDTTHFIRMFRREHGATPAAWRAASALPMATSR